jgi:hypothetical protein
MGADECALKMFDDLLHCFAAQFWQAQRIYAELIKGELKCKTAVAR